MTLFYKLSYKMLFAVGLLDIFKNLLLPKLSLLILVAVLMLADLVTGIAKARVLRQKITSKKMRHSVIKFLQYFGSIGIIVVLGNQNIENQNFVMVATWTRDGVTLLIIYIECLSVFENLYEMDKKNQFAMYFIRPVYWLLSFAVRNNRFHQAETEAKKRLENKRGEGNGEQDETYHSQQKTET